ncbi:ABC-F family ATP-binding cassette domain-containing protein [Chryseolinea sp. T2]|uniref:ABC-F family ATP-binding cassette domain-containing protein n=1 Tax=Chryseolinea sp. T2 TaxID=3129255 RepID=UPI00307827EA
MNYLSAELISKTYNDRWLFKDISIGISQGEKYALVGSNGVGKSTLLRILTGEIEPDSGQVSRKLGIRVAYLTQQPRVDGERLVKDVLFSNDNEIARVVREYEACLQNPNVDPDHMQKVLEKMEELNAWDYENKVHEVIEKLGVPGLEKKFGELSGGQRKRIFLAQLLLQDADLIILDEPTNHLDLQAIEWLENYLRGTQITLIMVTHDRYFLDNVVTEIFEIDRGQLFRYKGNYAYFLEKKAAREELLKIEVTKARNLLKKELEWMRRQPKARGTKAKYRVEAYYELEKKASQDLKKDKLELDIKEARQGGKILEVEHLKKKYGSLPIVNDFSYVFKKQDRIGVVGKNGIGKSTFLDMLVGKEKPDSGEITPGVTTKFGYFTQESISLNPANRLIEEVKQIAEFITLSDGSQISASKFLDNFLFPPEKQYTFIEKLSGGEKKRLQLLKLLVTNPNFLILDEPTNDFDIDTLNVLEDFLDKFTGCLMLVSHDRYFMDHLVNQLFVFEGDGTIRLFNGNYTDYRDWLSEQEEVDTKDVMPTVVKTEVVPAADQSSGKRKMTYKEKLEFEKLQGEIDTLEASKESLTKNMNTATDHVQLTQWAQEVERIAQLIDEKTARWITLSELEG